ncbi:MAG TPA: DUF5668 domain-containing protein [Candidatus Acidoferrum sp.]|jgi:hypothetical protein|nr:DUF5668 domain-containing protein [Candidatus Acidoferrum sp.]
MRRQYRSYFWPMVLIVIGLIALLVDLNVISADRLYRLADLWPLILIVIGLELIIRRTAHGRAMAVATILILLIAGLGAVAYVAVGPPIPGGTQTLTTSDPVGTLSAASLDLEVGAANLTVVGDSSLGADLYRAAVTYSGPKPDVTLDRSTGALRISQQGEFGIFGSLNLNIDLHVNPSVAWSFSLNSGATSASLNLTDVQLASLEANNGAIRLDLTVGPPKGIVPIRVNGGAPNLRFHRPSGVAVSVQLSGGALNLTADGHHTSAIGSASWQSDGDAGASDAYAIEVNGGACNVTVEANVPAA